jgi:ABC-type dipeptide/oligopeptide/nickel transport system permease component
MFAFLLRRLASLLPTLILVSMLIFGLQQLLPGDPAKILAGEDQDPQVIAYLQAKLHLDEPLPVRYGYWVWGVLQGDLGESVRTQLPVLDLILQKLPVTLELAVLAFLVAVLIGIPAGVISAVARGSAWDHIANLLSLWGLSTPNFWLGILLIMLFSVHLGWLPASGFLAEGGDVLPARNMSVDYARALCAATAGCAGITFEASAAEPSGSVNAYFKGTSLVTAGSGWWTWLLQGPATAVVDGQYGSNPTCVYYA